MKVIEHDCSKQDLKKAIPRPLRNLNGIDKLIDEFLKKKSKWFNKIIKKYNVSTGNTIFVRVNLYTLETINGISQTFYLDGLAIGDIQLTVKEIKGSLEWDISTREFP
jgi:hypothetical protein